MSKAIMLYLNQRFHGKLSLAIQVFEGTYPRKFLHQLVSSQLDMDRLDYLKRDSYFTGVVEGLVSASRIIKTLNVVDDRIVVESKGIYSVEKFIVARRLMYWQVYLHRAVLSAEYMIVNILKRAKQLMYGNHKLWKTPALEFLFGQNTLLEPTITPEVIERYIELDDNDIMVAVKQWRHSGDKVLELLCYNLLQRRLLKARLQDTPFPESKLTEMRTEYRRRLGLNEQEIKYFVFAGEISNMAYASGTQEPIEIVYKDGRVEDISTASDLHNIMTLSNQVKKHFICYPTW
jgi:uncharacterized protein